MSINEILEWHNYWGSTPLRTALLIFEEAAKTNSVCDANTIPEDVLNKMNELIEIYNHDGKVQIVDSEGIEDITQNIAAWVNNKNAV